MRKLDLSPVFFFDFSDLYPTQHHGSMSHQISDRLGSSLMGSAPTYSPMSYPGSLFPIGSAPYKTEPTQQASQHCMSMPTTEAPPEFEKLGPHSPGAYSQQQSQQNSQNQQQQQQQEGSSPSWTNLSLPEPAGVTRSGLPSPPTASGPSSLVSAHMHAAAAHQHQTFTNHYASQSFHHQQTRPSPHQSFYSYYGY